METRKHIAAEKKRCGSHNCAQAILHTRECPDCVADAAEFLEEQLNE